MSLCPSDWNCVEIARKSKEIVCKEFSCLQNGRVYKFTSRIFGE